MRLSNLEYVFLRLVRRFIFSEGFLLRYGRHIPYYRVNQGGVSPVPIVDLYWSFLHQKGIRPEGKTILELGIGATNSSGYEIIGRGAQKYIGYEPYVPFNKRDDDEICHGDILKRFSSLQKDRLVRVSRLERITDLVDIVFSHAVLEHVYDLDELLRALRKYLKQTACMIHSVDYRDHFNKYPFHFLQFSDTTWRRFLNPGDLTRHRISDHIRSFQRNGFSVEVLEKKLDSNSYERIKNHIHRDFLKYPLEDLATVSAVLFVTFDMG